MNTASVDARRSGFPRLSVLLLAIAVVLTADCSSPPTSYDTHRYVCSALCYFRNKEGALEREAMDGRGSNIEGAWRKLRSACDDRTEDRRQAELQVVTSEEMQEFRPVDRTRDCRED